MLHTLLSSALRRLHQLFRASSMAGGSGKIETLLSRFRRRDNIGQFPRDPPQSITRACLACRTAASSWEYFRALIDNKAWHMECRPADLELAKRTSLLLYARGWDYKGLFLETVEFLPMPVRLDRRTELDGGNCSLEEHSIG